MIERMKKHYSSRKILAIAIGMILLLALPIVVYLSTRTQNIDKGATGTGEVTIQFNPQSGTIPSGEPFTLDLHLVNLTSGENQRDIAIVGAQMIIAIDPQLVVDTANTSCSPSTYTKDLERIEVQEGNKLVIWCGTNFNGVVLSPNVSAALATIALQTAPGASVGSTVSLDFQATTVVNKDISSEPDVSTAGESAVYTVTIDPTPTPTDEPVPTLTPSPTPTATPEPTLTPEPTPTTTPEPTPTATPVPEETITPTITPEVTVTPSATAVPTPATCEEKKIAGDYTCNDALDEEDYSTWLTDFLKGAGNLIFFEYWRRAFFLP